MRKLTCLSLLLAATLAPAAEKHLPNTKPLTWNGDLSYRMRQGFDKFLMRELKASIPKRRRYWKVDYSSKAAFYKSTRPNRQRLARMIGVVDPRVKYKEPEVLATINHSGVVAESATIRVRAIRWPVFKGVHGEGLLLEPKTKPQKRQIVVIPDADQTPEMLAGMTTGKQKLPLAQQTARRLAELGFRVVVPVLIDRTNTWSGKPSVAMTNATHREWVYRQAFQLGRHIIGYEVQKIRSLTDWLTTQGTVGVFGYGEGGLIALYTAALDRRIESICISGYFGDRQRTWSEPIYRNVFGFLTEFGDAELVHLIGPREVTLEQADLTTIAGPPAATGRRMVASPGTIQTVSDPQFISEVRRLGKLQKDRPAKWPQARVTSGFRPDGTKPFGSPISLYKLTHPKQLTTKVSQPKWTILVTTDARARQKRQVEELVEYNQQLLRHSVNVRAKFWRKEMGQVKPGAHKDWQKITAAKRDYFWRNLVGRYPMASIKANPRTRFIRETDKWRAYEVVLDVFPDVFSWGILVLPKGMKPNERRPVVVCQHGLEGTPFDALETKKTTGAWRVYRGFAADLADHGFITFAPHNFYRGGDHFRLLQRKAQAVKKTLFGITTIQHARILEWLSTLPNVDPKRMGFYGLSYGGNTAMRVPALLPQYSAVIASGDFNEWNYKNATVDHIYSMIYHGVFEVFEFDLGHTFNHSELAALICPRPFMVERGHRDGVALDEWVASEYARVRRLYVQLGIGQRTEIEFFNGPHRINAVGTVKFLKKHLKWK